MINFGMVKPGDVLYVYFDTFSGSTGAPITMTNFAAGDILIYKDGGTTQRASTSGFTLLDTDGVDFDGITGIQGFSIDLADNTTAGFYVSGSRYTVVVSTVTVDSQTVSFVAANFRIGYTDAILNTTIATLASQTSFTLTAGPAEDSALIGCTLLIHDIASAVQLGKGVVSAYTGSTKTVTLAAGVTFTAAAGDNVAVFIPALQPTTWGRTLDVSATGEAGVDWANVGSPTTTLALTNTTIATTQKVDLETIKTNPVVNAGTVTFPTTATLASTTNITAGTVTTATNLTNERGKYANGAVWIGPIANTNTTNYTDGIITNPVSTIAAAKTIADSLNLRRFYITRTASISLGADYVGYDFDGSNWTLTTTGSRDVSTSHFVDANVTGGTYASTTGSSTWEGCEFATGVSVAAVNMIGCRFGGTLTLNAAGNYDFIDCSSIVAGTSTPVFAIPAGTVNVSFRRWSGGISITGITSATTISIDVVSGGTITLAGADGNVQVRGMVAAITDNRTGAPTLGQNAAINMTKINTEADTALTDYDPPTNAEMEARTLVSAGYATPTNITAGTITNVTNLTNAPTNGDLTATMKASVNAEVVDALATDTYAEPGQGAPAATTTLAAKINYLYKAWRNRITQTATTYSLYNDDAATVDQKATVSDNGTTYDKGEIATGP